MDLEKLIMTKDDELLVEFPGYTRADLRKMKRDAKLPVDFLQFMKKGRTVTEIGAKFGNKGMELLHKPWDKYELYKQLDEEDRVIFVLLPKPEVRLSFKERDWQYHIGKSPDGGKQPYLLVQLPPTVWEDDKVTVVPLFDVHYGHKEHKVEKFRSYLEWVRQNDNIFIIVGGDMMENALDDGRGMTYEQIKTPESQINDLCTMLAPVRHKILFFIPGNHEWRTAKKSGIDPTKLIADRLEVPYFSGPVYLSLCIGDLKTKFYVKHGRSGAATKGGKINNVGKSRAFLDFVHFIVMGHVHDPAVTSETCIVENVRENRLDYRQQWMVIAQSFLGWERTYAYRGEFPPTGLGGVSMEIYKNGDYRAELR